MVPQEFLSRTRAELNTMHRTAGLPEASAILDIFENKYVTLFKQPDTQTSVLSGLQRFQLQELVGIAVLRAKTVAMGDNRREELYGRVSAGYVETAFVQGASYLGSRFAIGVQEVQLQYWRSPAFSDVPLKEQVKVQEIVQEKDLRSLTVTFQRNTYSLESRNMTTDDDARRETQIQGTFEEKEGGKLTTAAIRVFRPVCLLG